ncbi:hypothetical protein RB195_024086 [Necator americanus]|uniref:Uncharacterized protein n=1 Tax=Necator americanus TaxID=51031 RepID=A0ABR1ELX8_NECAM
MGLATDVTSTIVIGTASSTYQRVWYNKYARITNVPAKVSALDYESDSERAESMPEGNMESLATNIRLVTLNCLSLSSELQQAALSRLLNAALQKTRIKDRALISIDNYTIYCRDADERKVGGCAIAVRNDYNNLVEEFGLTSSRCALYDCRIAVNSNSGSKENRLRKRLCRQLKRDRENEWTSKTKEFEKEWEDKNP